MLSNPYLKVPRAEKARSTIDIPLKEIQRLKRVHPGSILQTVLNTLYKKLLDELELCGFTQFDPEGLEYAVQHCTITLGGGGANAGLASRGKRHKTPKAANRNVGRRTPRLARPPLRSEAASGVGSNPTGQGSVEGQTGAN